MYRYVYYIVIINKLLYRYVYYIVIIIYGCVDIYIYMYNYTKPEGKMILICYVDHIMYVCIYIYMGNIMYIIYI